MREKLAQLVIVPTPSVRLRQKHDQPYSQLDVPRVDSSLFVVACSLRPRALPAQPKTPGLTFQALPQRSTPIQLTTQMKRFI